MWPLLRYRAADREQSTLLPHRHSRSETTFSPLLNGLSTRYSADWIQNTPCLQRCASPIWCACRHPAREFWEKFNSINGKHVDFVLCDETLAPVVAIELDDASHNSAACIKRDGFVDSVFQSAALPIVHVPAKRGYVLEEIRQLLAPHLAAKSANIVNPPDAKYLPRKGWRPSA